MPWVKYSQTAPELDCGFLLQEGTVSKMSEADMDAYRAPFPGERYMAGARVMPTLAKSQAATNRKAWKVLAAFDKPFLTTFSDRDPMTKGGYKLFQRKSRRGKRAATYHHQERRTLPPRRCTRPAREDHQRPDCRNLGRIICL
ncbi:MAG: hypothetical protein HOI15_15315 [Opitutales bacterium]|nr:hypothetical protein [Opitutales bacterium]